MAKNRIVGNRLNLGYFVGKYTLYSSENQEIDQGKYVSVLKNIDGK